MGWEFAKASLERRRTVPVPLSTAWTDGNAFHNILTFTQWTVPHWAFVKDVQGYVYGVATIPWNVQPQAYVVGFNVFANVTSGVTRMAVATAPIADGEQLNFASFESNAATDVTMPGTAYLQKKVELAMPSATWAPGDTLLVMIWHDGTHANDTLTQNTLLLNAWLRLE